LQEQAYLKARVRRRYKCTTMSERDQPIAPNLLARRFEAEHPNQRRVTDTTELPSTKLCGGVTPKPGCFTTRTRADLRERGLPQHAHRSWHHLQHEPPRRLPRERCDEEPVLYSEVRARGTLHSATDAKDQLVGYIEVFHDQKRRHSSVGNVAPAEAERRYAVGVQPAA
jgi:putative transposase